MHRFKRQKLPTRPVHPTVQWVWEEINNRALSQHDVAAQAGVSSSAMRRWRAGEREPSYQGLEAVVNALGYELVLRKRERKDV